LGTALAYKSAGAHGAENEEEESGPWSGRDCGLMLDAFGICPQAGTGGWRDRPVSPIYCGKLSKSLQREALAQAIAALNHMQNTRLPALNTHMRGYRGGTLTGPAPEPVLSVVEGSGFSDLGNREFYFVRFRTLFQKRRAQRVLRLRHRKQRGIETGQTSCPPRHVPHGTCSTAPPAESGFHPCPGASKEKNAHLPGNRASSLTWTSKSITPTAWKMPALIDRALAPRLSAFENHHRPCPAMSPWP